MTISTNNHSPLNPPSMTKVALVATEKESLFPLISSEPVDPMKTNDPQVLSKYLIEKYSLTTGSSNPQKAKFATLVMEATATGDYHELHRLRNRIDRSIGLAELLENPKNATKITDNKQVKAGGVVVSSGALGINGTEGHGSLILVKKIAYTKASPTSSDLNQWCQYHGVKYHLDFTGYNGLTTSDSRTNVRTYLSMGIKGKSKTMATSAAIRTEEYQNSYELIYHSFIGDYVLHDVCQADLDHGFAVAKQHAETNSQLREKNTDSKDDQVYHGATYGDYNYNCNNTVFDTVLGAIDARDRRLSGKMPQTQSKL